MASVASASFTRVTTLVLLARATAASLVGTRDFGSVVAAAALPERRARVCRLAISEAAPPRLELPIHAALLPDPLPALPVLDASEELLVQSGRCLRWQQPPNQQTPFGSGFAVQELHADADEVFDALSAFGRYPELISTVRTATEYAAPEGADDEPPNVSRYRFVVSRIRLVLNVCFAVDAAQRYASWRLDKPSWVLDDSTGYWRVQQLPERPGVLRVWFCVSVQLSPIVPNFVVGLVSRLGLRKATRWLKALEQPPAEQPPPEQPPASAV